MAGMSSTSQRTAVPVWFPDGTRGLRWKICSSSVRQAPSPCWTGGGEFGNAAAPGASGVYVSVPTRIQYHERELFLRRDRPGPRRTPKCRSKCRKWPDTRWTQVLLSSGPRLWSTPARQPRYTTHHAGESLATMDWSANAVPQSANRQPSKERAGDPSKFRHESEVRLARSETGDPLHRQGNAVSK